MQVPSHLGGSSRSWYRVLLDFLGSGVPDRGAGRGFQDNPSQAERDYDEAQKQARPDSVVFAKWRARW